MIRGLYTSTAGMLAAQSQSEIIGDNIANLSTPGFKQEQGSNHSFPTLLLERINDGSKIPEQTPIGSIGTGVVVDRTARLTVQGALNTTGISTDLALVSDQNQPIFFAVQTDNGVMYTRNGRFQLSAEGQLQTMDGHAVLGENGPINGLDVNFTVSSDGMVLNGQGEEVDRLVVRQLPEDNLTRVGNSLYTSTQATQAQNFQVKQGAFEASNVDLTTQITKMMTVMRAYEANQRVIQTQDATLDKAVNEVGKV